MSPSGSDSEAPKERKPVKKATKNRDVAKFELGDKRRVVVRTYNGKTYVDIREFYWKDGDLAPGIKGILLTPKQWKSLLDSACEVNEALKEN